jgi:hypothetical protein
MDDVVVSGLGISPLTKLRARIRLPSFGRTDFYPPKPASLSELRSLCLGSKSQALGDSLVLSALARPLKKAYPGLRITYYNRAFNPVVFYGNPAISGPDFSPKAIYGDDLNLGGGHLIQQKERFLDLPVTDDPKPELYLLEHETKWAKEWIRRQSPDSLLPVCILHPAGKTNPNVIDHAFWSQMVARWKNRVRFWQIGVQGQPRIPGCDRYLMGPKDTWHLRNDFAIISQAELFLGVDSGPMHIARAFSIPSLVLTRAEGIQELFKRRKSYPYFLFNNWKNSFIYESNQNVSTTGVAAAEIQTEIDSFFEKRGLA